MCNTGSEIKNLLKDTYVNHRLSLQNMPGSGRTLALPCSCTALLVNNVRTRHQHNFINIKLMMQIDNLVFSTTYKKVTEKLIIPGSIGTAATVFYTNVIKSLTAIST